MSKEHSDSADPAHAEVKAGIANRIVGLEYVDVGLLKPHPKNWRIHGADQRSALRAVFKKIGVTNAIVAYRSEKYGGLVIIDGHLRKDELGGGTVPVLVTNLTDEEAEIGLATHDRLTYMAETDEMGLRALYEELTAKSDGFAELNEMMGLDAMDKDEDDEDGDRAGPKQGDPTYPITPRYDEGYNAIIIVAKSDTEWAQLRTLIAPPQCRDRRGALGATSVVTAQMVLERLVVNPHLAAPVRPEDM